MRFVETTIPGLVELVAQPLPDNRGRFVKTFVRGEFSAAGLPGDFVEEFYSYSIAGVLRGLHFQLPPQAQAKTVFCEHGAIFDVVLDLRVGSPAYGTALTFELTGKNGRGLFIPEGLAHGFRVLGDGALVAYRTTTAYSPKYDAGVRWDSAGIAWPSGPSVISERDATLPAFSEFANPFVFDGGDGR
ncbi:MAG: dTDP-4-dehydrorhamnose 3,5-epimerase [Coriobacteriia bacterium]